MLQQLKRLPTVVISFLLRLQTNLAVVPFMKIVTCFSTCFVPKEPTIVNEILRTSVGQARPAQKHSYIQRLHNKFDNTDGTTV